MDIHTDGACLSVICCSLVAVTYTHITQDSFADNEAIVGLPQRQTKPDKYVYIDHTDPLTTDYRTMIKQSATDRAHIL